MELKDGTLIAASLAKVDRERVYKLDTRRYAPDYLTSADADELPWTTFRRRLPVLFGELLGIGDLDLLVVAKSVTWSDRDVNVYVGSGSARPPRWFLDLSGAEFAAVFGWHLELACRMSAAIGQDVYVTHGFNPEDKAPDAHSVGAKFHTHLHIPQTVERYPASLRELSPFERLALIEPYSQVFWDRAVAWLGSRSGWPWRSSPGFGFFSIQTSLSELTGSWLRDLYALLRELHDAYLDVVAALTGGSEEPYTGCQRYTPRPSADRVRMMSQFLADNSEWLSGKSAALLAYLARNLRTASPRDTRRSTQIRSAAEAWIAKGMSGALNFVVSAARGTLRFDFAPRVISTSGATKVISTEPTVIVKDQGIASPAEQRRMADFQAVVVEAAASLSGRWTA